MMEIELETMDFGACCSCDREKENVHNIVMLEQKTKVPGSGWGCVQCGLPADGAVAVICDDCLGLGRPIVYAVAGQMKSKKRIPVADLGAEHKHDLSKHPEADYD